MWKDLLENLDDSLAVIIARIEDRDVETIPGAKDALVRRLQTMRSQFPRDEGEVLKRLVLNTIERSFFPRSRDLATAFDQILDARTEEQDYIIQELLTGFTSSEKKGVGVSREGTVLDKFIEALRKSKNFSLSEQAFFAMFGSYTRPRKYVRRGLQNLVDFFGLERYELVIEKDLKTSERKVVNFYKFPDELLEILDGRYIDINPETRGVVVRPTFDKTVMISLLLANWSVNRTQLKKYTINGIADILTLVLLLGSLPALKVEDSNPLLREDTFDPSHMSVVPKSWMMQNVLIDLFLPLVKIVAYLLGGPQWVSKIEDTEARKKIHNQVRFLIKDVNKWVLGNLCRVEIPVFVEISNIFTEVTVGIDRGEGE